MCNRSKILEIYLLIIGIPIRQEVSTGLIEHGVYSLFEILMYFHFKRNTFLLNWRGRRKTEKYQNT